MRRYMKFAALALVAGLAACNAGSQSYTPSGGQSTAPGGGAMASIVQRLPAQQPSIGDAIVPWMHANALPKCSAGTASLPGTYTSIFTFGRVRGGSYSSANSRAVWVEASFTSSTHPPVPIPTVLPSIPPTAPGWIYYGTYSLNNAGTGGCAYAMSLWHTHIPGIRRDGAFGAIPNLGTLDFNFKIIGAGTALVNISGLNAHNPTGTVTLYNDDGSVHDTGTINLTGAFKIGS